LENLRAAPIAKGCKLTVLYPDGARRSFSFDSPTVYVGRGLGNDLRLAHSAVCSRHLIVQHDERGLFVTHLAENGETRFHGELLQPYVTQQIEDHSVLELGSLRLSVQLYEDVDFFEVIDGSVIDGNGVDDDSEKNREGLARPSASDRPDQRPRREAATVKHHDRAAPAHAVEGRRRSSDFQSWRSSHHKGSGHGSVGIPWVRLLQYLGVFVFFSALVFLAVLTQL